MVMLFNPIGLVFCNRFIFNFKLIPNWKDVSIFLFLSWLLTYNHIKKCKQVIDFYNLANLVMIMAVYLS